MERKKSIVTIISLIIIVVSKWVPAFAGLTEIGATALVSTLGLILLLIFDALPVGLIAFIMIAVQPLLGLTDSLAQTASLFASPIFFFTLVGFGISAVMSKVPLTKRILRFFMKRFGKTTKGAILAICVTAGVFSTVIANFPVMLLFLALALSFLEIFEQEEDKKKTGKTLFILMPVIIAIGGIMTPVGNVPMMLCSGFLAEKGYPVSFFQWLLMGGIAGIIMLPFVFIVVCKLFPPAELSQEKKEHFISSLDIPEKFTKQEKYVCIILGATILGWILSSKVPGLDMMLVGLVALCFLLFPGFEIITWKEYNDKVNWATVMLVGSILALCNVLSNTGVIQWMVDFFMNVIPKDISPMILILLLAVFTFLVNMIMTNSPAFFSLFGVPIIGVAMALAIHPAVLAYPLAIFATFPILLPLEAVYLIAYTQGYYSVKDMMKAGIINSCIVAVVVALWVPFILRVMGIY